jgi:hypothetical protein
MNWLALTRAGFGAAVLLAPDEIAGHIGDRQLGGGTRTAMRRLGVRLLAEAAICAERPSRSVLALEGAVDVIHGVTMAAVAMLSRNNSRRRVAAANVGSAAAFTVADVVAVRRHRPAPHPASSAFLQLRDSVADRLCEALMPSVG